MTAAETLINVECSSTSTTTRKNSQFTIDTDIWSGPQEYVDSEFVLPTCIVPSKHELGPVETFVASAVREQHEQMNDHHPCTKYKSIVDSFRSSKTDVVMIYRLLLALRTADNGTILLLLTSNSIQHTRLIHQILRFSPFELPNPSRTIINEPNSSNDDHNYQQPQQQQQQQQQQNSINNDIANAYFRLLIAILSSNSAFLVPSLTSLWRMAAFKSSDVSIERPRHVHAALATILRIVPKARAEFFPIISSNCPFRMRPKDDIVWYYQQSLYVLRYIPVIESSILQLLVDKSLEIDVEIRVNNGEQAIIDDEPADDDIFDFDPEEEEQQQQQTHKNMISIDTTVDDIAEKLDALMLLLFQYVEATPMSTLSYYQIFTQVFESSILLTHKSKFVQFILFHVCGVEATISKKDTNEQMLYRDFCARLIDIVLDEFRSTVTRQTCACYLASFVSRASYVNAETVCEAVGALLRWAEAYIHAMDVSPFLQAADAREQCNVHALFYTVCQSAFYVMCFRGPEALNFYHGSVGVHPDHGQIETTYLDISYSRWTRLCKHPLQPLKFCLETVRTEFIYISKVYNVLNVDVIQDFERSVASSGRQRKRKMRQIRTAATLEKERMKGGVGGMGGGANPLDSFFPFDPYLLRLSHRFVEPFYRHWGDTVDDIAVILTDECNDHVSDDVVDDDDTAILSGEDNDDLPNEPCAALSDEDSDQSDGDSTLNDDDMIATSFQSLQPLSLASNATSLSGRSQSETINASDVDAKREVLKEQWHQALKRSRAGSIENGSW